jgi:hypothetical protein
MNAFTKHNDAWVIKADRADLAGQDIIVTTRAGAQKNVTLAQYLGPTQGGRFDGHLYAIAERAPAAAAQEVGDLSRIMQLFANAAAAQPNRRRPPAIVFADFRINVAGERAREPGSLTITSSTERDDRGMRKWLGRITRAGMFEPARSTPAAIGDRLRAFAADPAAVAAQHGQVTKSCCFCNKNLTDPRSRTVGYGPDCASNFGLPWGAVSEAEGQDCTDPDCRVCEVDDYEGAVDSQAARRAESARTFAPRRLANNGFFPSRRRDYA